MIGCQTILTAAHCICEAGGTAGPCPNGTFILDPVDYLIFIPHAGEFFVRDVSIAPGYDFGVASDVALLELEFPVRSVAPEMINALASPGIPTSATIAGFGTLSGTSADSQIKREGDVVTSNCAGSGVSDDEFICWTDPAATTCSGDSGGPLFADVGAGITVAGVHSGGTPVCTLASPAFDTDVFVNSPWIASAGGADLGFAACGDGAQVGDPSVVEDDFNAVVTTSADHTVSVASGVKLLRIALNAEVGSPIKNDLDLYVKFGAPASSGDFDCGPQLENSMEICEFPDPMPGTWHINVDVFAGGPAEYQVTSVQLPPNPAPPGIGPNDVMVTDFLAWEVMQVDGQSGDRSILSSTLSGSGSELKAPEGIIASPDESELLVANLAQLAIVSIDPDTGDRTVVSGCDDLLVIEDPPTSICLGSETGAGLSFLGPRFLAYEADLDLVVSDRSAPGLASVVRVDPATGDRSIVSGCTNSTCGSTAGSGPLLDRPFGIAVADDGSIIVGDSFGILSIDPDTGARTAISGCTDSGCTSTVGSGPLFVQPGELHIEASGDIVVVDGSRSVMRVDPANGNRTVISGCSDSGCSSVIGSGLEFTDQLFGLDPLAGGDFLTADSELQAIIRVNGANGDRTVVSGCADAACSSLVGSGTAFTDPVGIVVVPEPSGVLGLLAGVGLLAELRRRRG
jgi:hypothetical protein